MLDILLNWWFAPAKPYEFWLPQSGATGGMIFLVITGVLAAVGFCIDNLDNNG